MACCPCNSPIMTLAQLLAIAGSILVLVYAASMSIALSVLNALGIIVFSITWCAQGQGWNIVMALLAFANAVYAPIHVTTYIDFSDDYEFVRWGPLMFCPLVGAGCWVVVFICLAFCIYIEWKRDEDEELQSCPCCQCSCCQCCGGRTIPHAGQAECVTAIAHAVVSEEQPRNSPKPARKPKRTTPHAESVASKEQSRTSKRKEPARKPKRTIPRAECVVVSEEQEPRNSKRKESRNPREWYSEK